MSCHVISRRLIPELELDTLKIPQLAAKMKEEGISDEAVEKLVHEEIDGKAFLALKESDLVTMRF